MEAAEEEDDINLGVNPSLADLKPEDLEKMKGDAIGSTLYSERWVLKTLMKLSELKDLSGWNDEFESELCSLWDMTTEKDVVDFLLQHDILSILSPLLNISNNSRFTEILVGTLGNMCCFESFRLELCRRSECVQELLKLLDLPDAHVLIQFVRLLHSTAWDIVKESPSLVEEPVPPHWLETSISNGSLVNFFAFILKSSTNDDLLYVSLEFLNTMCSIDTNDKDFSHFFSTPDLVSGMLDAWQQIFGSSNPEDGFSNKQTMKAAAHWTAVLSSFGGHEQGRQVLCAHGQEIGRIASLMVNRPIDFLDVILISSVDLLESIVNAYFNDVVLKKLLEILNLLYQNQGEPLGDQSFENLDAVLQSYIEAYCCAVVVSVKRPVLNAVLSQCNENHILLFWKTISDQIGDPGERSC